MTNGPGVLDVFPTDLLTISKLRRSNSLFSGSGEFHYLDGTYIHQILKAERELAEVYWDSLTNQPKGLTSITRSQEELTDVLIAGYVEFGLARTKREAETLINSILNQVRRESKRSPEDDNSLSAGRHATSSRNRTR
jgi:hypothetical protein